MLPHQVLEQSQLGPVQTRIVQSSLRGERSSSCPLQCGLAPLSLQPPALVSLAVTLPLTLALNHCLPVLHRSGAASLAQILLHSPFASPSQTLPITRQQLLHTTFSQENSNLSNMQLQYIPAEYMTEVAGFRHADGGRWLGRCCQDTLQ